MQLWTWHEPDFSLTSGRLDHSRSQYYKIVDGAPDAYAELAQRLSTDQIIWCYVRRDDYHDLPKLTRVEWALDVPDTEILAITDAYIWNKILRIHTYPRSLYFEWLEYAPTDGAARVEFIEHKIEEYHAQLPPDGGWWSQLFITDTMPEGATVLLKHPIPEAWVVCVGASVV